jgi:cytidylate kinase
MEVKKQRKRVVCIAGMTGSGKSTTAKRLAKKYSFRYLSGGNALKALAAEMGYNTRDRGWWGTVEGTNFLKHRLENLEFDKKVDETLMEEARRGNVILDSWTMPWLLKESFRIWLEADVDVRARRATKRDNLEFKKALGRVKEKDEQTRAIYKKLYGFNLGTDFSPFDFILDTNNLETEEVFQTVCLIIENIIIKTT